MQPKKRFHRDMSASGFLAAWLDDSGLDGNERATFQAYYTHYLHQFSPLLRASYDRRVAPVLRILHGLPPGARLLEIGSGCGTESLYFALQGARVTAVEVVDRMIATARSRQAVLEAELGEPLPLEFRYENILDYTPTEPFDVIWMEEAFHHLEPRPQVVKKVASLLRPGGHLVIAEANALNPLIQAHLYKLRGWPRVEEVTDASGKTSLYGVECVLSAWRLTRWFRRQGIARTELEYHRFFPSGVRPSPLLTWLDAMGHRWLPRALKRFLCVQYNYVGVREALVGSD